MHITFRIGSMDSKATAKQLVTDLTFWATRRRETMEAKRRAATTKKDWHAADNYDLAMKDLVDFLASIEVAE